MDFERVRRYALVVVLAGILAVVILACCAIKRMHHKTKVRRPAPPGAMLLRVR